MIDPRAPRFCTACGSGLPADARFCAQCGHAVAADAGVSVRAEPAGERRPVVVLFADLTGYTRLSSELDPEEVHRLLSRYFERADAAIAHYGGTIDKHIGDAVMGVFGAPVAHGNDAERAIRAALRIQDGMAEVSREFGRPLLAHIGVASGEVVAAGIGSSAYREYTVTGDAVNLAARLDEMAKGGEILVSGEVQAAVAQLVEAESRGEVTVRGIPRPVGVWKIGSLSGAKPAAAAPLVGRGTERRRFAGWAADTRDSRRGGVVLLRGEPGIGKTRLVQECQEIAEAAGYAVHRGLVLDFGVGRGEDAAGELVSTLLGNPPQAHPGSRRAALDAAVADGRLAIEQSAFAAELMDLPLEGEAKRLHDAMDNAARTRGKGATLAALLARASRLQPRLLVVEDIHWADSELLGQLAALGRGTAEHPALLLMTTRVEGDPAGAA